MKLKVFSIRDSKVEAYMRPFFANTVPEATRIFSDSINSPESGFARHPEDYCLFCIGEFDDEKGLLTHLPQPQSLGLAVDYVKQAALPFPNLNQPNLINEARN